jgi:hypothetical protein
MILYFRPPKARLGEVRPSYARFIQVREVWFILAQVMSGYVMLGKLVQIRSA